MNHDPKIQQFQINLSKCFPRNLEGKEWENNKIQYTKHIHKIPITFIDLDD